MLQPCNCIKFPLSAANPIKIKSLIPNHTITKCFSFCEKTFLILPLSSALQVYFSILDLSFKQMVEICAFTNFDFFWQISRKLSRCWRPHGLRSCLEICYVHFGGWGVGRHKCMIPNTMRIFLQIFIIIVYYSWFYFKVSDMRNVCLQI